MTPPSPSSMTRSTSCKVDWRCVMRMRVRPASASRSVGSSDASVSASSADENSSSTCSCRAPPPPSLEAARVRLPRAASARRSAAALSHPPAYGQ
eukprot:scaffold25100_cov68-Phaeocystis_antarctica.AAC.1